VSFGTHQKDGGKRGSDDLSSGLPYARINNPNDTARKAAVDTSPVEPNVSTMAIETVHEDEDGVEVIPDVDDALPDDVEDKCPPRRRCSGWYGKKYNHVFQQTVESACPLQGITT
jgi:hypothetical protein